MGTIRQYVKENVFKKRLEKKAFLTVYDKNHFYKEICKDMGDDVFFLDISEHSPLDARLIAFEHLSSLYKSKNSKKLLIYIDSALKLEDEDLQINPFSVFNTFGSVFPEGDGDDFLNLSLKAMPNEAVRIRKIFSEVSLPTFSMLESIEGQNSYPVLSSYLGADNPKDLLVSLLLRNKDLENDSWTSEARELFKSCLDLNLLTRTNNLEAMQEELWRFVLFSEFVFDLPGKLPGNLESIPIAFEHSKQFVFDICDTLRSDVRYQGIYVDRAEQIENELNLLELCKSITDLGERETFPFEERSILTNIVDKFNEGDLDTARLALKKRYKSVWSIKSESQILWTVVDASIKLIDLCTDLSFEYVNHVQSIESIIDFYVDRFREADRTHREFEEAVSDMIYQEEGLSSIIDMARSRYRILAGKVHDVFIRNFQKNGWPVKKHFYNSEIYNRVIEPLLKQSGKKIAYFHIDALRYELGVVLEKELMTEGQTNLDISYAQLPTVTPVGMTSLLPDAANKLELKRDNNNVAVFLDGVKINDVSKRMSIFQNKLGDRFQELTIDDFNKPRKKIEESVELLVLRDTDIDSFLENDPSALLPMIYRALKKIRVSINKLKKLKFDEVIISTDHGFFLNGEFESGDKCPMPSGNWVNLHNRLLLGDGSEDSSNFVIPTAKIDIKGDFNTIASPRSLVTYRKGETFFHGGISLQECILPLLRIKLTGGVSTSTKRSISISYKNSATSITTRMPVFTLEYEAEGKSMNLFGEISEVEVLFEAHDLNGNVIGEAKLGGVVNSATRVISMNEGDRVQVALKMQMDYEGEFVVRALNPNTLGKYAELKLKTDYMV